MNTPAVLVEAAAAAGYAPSIHNTQPWHWRVQDGTLRLYADRSRQLQASDPDGRMLTISCGAALHHARVALAAEGWHADIHRLHVPAEPDLLAEIVLSGYKGVAAEAMRHFQTLALRRTDRRPVGPTPPSAEAISRIREAAAVGGVNIHLLTEDQVAELGSAAAHADQAEIMDREQRLELTYWVGGDHPKWTGVPSSVIPDEAPSGPVPGRDFVRAGTLATHGHDRAAAYLLMFGDADEPVNWLWAGEALSAAWLAATEEGLSVLPFSSVIEVPSTRAAMRALLSGLGHPYLVLRLGIADPAHSFPPHTPRLPAEQTITFD